MIKNKIFILFAIIGIVFVAQTASAITIDLWDSFPDTQGDNGFYAYAYNLYNHSVREIQDTGTRIFKTPASPWGIPLIHGQSSSPWIYWHPTYSEDAILAWRVPETNLYHVTGMIDCVGGGPGYIKGYLLKVGDSSPLWQGYDGAGAGTSFDKTISLSAGDMLYFGLNVYGNQDNDTSRLMGQIDYTPNQVVPEPASVVLLGMGLVGFLARRKKSFRP